MEHRPAVAYGWPEFLQSVTYKQTMCVYVTVGNAPSCAAGGKGGSDKSYHLTVTTESDAIRWFEFWTWCLQKHCALRSFSVYTAESDRAVPEWEWYSKRSLCENAGSSSDFGNFFTMATTFGGIYYHQVPSNHWGNSFVGQCFTEPTLLHKCSEHLGPPTLILFEQIYWADFFTVELPIRDPPR